MDFALMTEPQLGGTYEQLLAAARWAEQQGMVAFARSDHYYSQRTPPPEATDAFATLAGLARDTERIRLCVLVTPITFRHPAVIARSATTIDQMSGGRLDLGVGTGWMELEHEAFGLPFPPWPERFERLTEALGYLTAAFRQSPAVFRGSHYRIEADVRPRPEGLRIVVGGSGRDRTPRLAARYADEYNTFFTTPEELAERVDVLRKAAAEAGREPDGILVSAMGRIFTGRDEAEYRETIARAARFRGIEPAAFEQRLRDNHVPHGPPDRIGETLDGLARAGMEKAYIQWLDLTDLEGLQSAWEAIREGVR